MEAARRPSHPRPRDQPLRPVAGRHHLRRAHLPARRRATTTCGPTAWPPSRRSAASRPSCPACSPCSASPTCRSGSSPRPVTSSTRCSCTSAWKAGLDAAIVHAARIMPLNRIDEHQREVALDLVYDRRRDGYDPLQELLAVFEGVDHPTVEKEDRSGWPVDERLKHRIIDGDRDGLEADLDEALTSHTGPRDRERRPARGHEGGRRALRLGRDAAPVRAAVRRVHEDGRRLPRAPHGEGRPGRQGAHRAGHGQGRRARHRQEPGRHHPHQQRLRGVQPRHQGVDRRPHRQGRGGRRRRDRHERAAREEHADHARQPRGAEPARPRRRCRCCWAARR